MRGPVASLGKAGASGKHVNNVRRDWFRQMERMEVEHHVPCLDVYVYFHLMCAMLKTLGVQTNICVDVLYLYGMRYLCIGLTFRSWTCKQLNGLKLRSTFDWSKYIFILMLCFLISKTM